MSFYYECGMLKQIARALSLSLLCPNILLLKQLISITLFTFVVVHIGVNITSLYGSINRHFNCCLLKMVILQRIVDYRHCRIDSYLGFAW
jgi:hypothetical protein